MKRKYSSEEKESHIEQWRTREQSRVSYAREHGLAPQTFSKWVNESEHKKNGLVELPKKLTRHVNRENKGNGVIIRKKDVRIYIPLDTEKEVLSYLIETLVRA